MNLPKIFIGGLLLLTMACSSKRTLEQSEPAATPPPAPEASPSAAPAPEAAAKAEPAKPAEDMQIVLKKDGKPVGTVADASSAPAEQAPPQPKEIPGIPAEKALSWLKNGNIRFVKHRLRNDGQGRKDVSRLAKNQRAHSVILSCSDSRVPPELVFDQKLGEVFVVRTAGPTLDEAVIASIESAVAALHTNLIVVMGHTQCAAVKASLSILEGGDAGSPFLNALVGKMRPHLMSYAHKAPSPEFEKEAWSTVAGVSEELSAKSMIIRDAVNSGALKIVSAVYHVDDGKVDWNSN